MFIRMSRLFRLIYLMLFVVYGGLKLFYVLLFFETGINNFHIYLVILSSNKT